MGQIYIPNDTSLYVSRHDVVAFSLSKQSFENVAYVLVHVVLAYVSDFEFIWKTWVKLDIWAFHGLFYIWVDDEVILSGRNRARVID